MLCLLAGLDAHAGCAGVGLVSCSASVSATNLAFGSYNPTSATADSVTSTVSVNGTVTGLGLLTTMSYSVSLSAGSAGTVAARKLNGPAGALLGYNLYSDSTYATVWGVNTVTDSFSAFATLGGTTVGHNYTVYGRIPAGQFVAPGTYSSTITVTVNF